MNFLEELQSLDFNDIGRWPTIFRILFVGLFFVVVVGAGFYFLVYKEKMPQLQRVQQESGAKILLALKAFSMFALARLILNIPLGLLSDRYGRRILLIGGPIVTAIGMIGSGLSMSIEVLLAWRFVAGAGSAMYMTGAMIYLTDISTPETRARFIGTNQGARINPTAARPIVARKMRLSTELARRQASSLLRRVK